VIVAAAFTFAHMEAATSMFPIVRADSSSYRSAGPILANGGVGVRWGPPGGRKFFSRHLNGTLLEWILKTCLMPSMT
jgi:hypothetical protein